MIYIKKEQLPPWQLGITQVGNSFGSRIRRARIAKNMTIHDLAEKINIDSIHLMRIENERHKPSLPTLRKISRVLDVPVNTLGSFDLLPESTMAECIKKARLTLGLTKREFSKIIGVNPKTIGQWESIKTKPSMEKMALIVELMISLGINHIYS